MSGDPTRRPGPGGGRGRLRGRHRRARARQRRRRHGRRGRQAARPRARGQERGRARGAAPAAGRAAGGARGRERVRRRDRRGRHGAGRARAATTAASSARPSMLRTRLIEPPSFRRGEPIENTTLVCLMTDADAHEAGLRDRREDGARRDGARGRPGPLGRRRRRGVHARERRYGGRPESVDPLIAGVVAAALTAEAIRDACRPRDRGGDPGAGGPRRRGYFLDALHARARTGRSGPCARPKRK